jgi:hypothetical protein
VARWGSHAWPECPDRGAGRRFGKPASDGGRVGGADGSGDGVRPIPGPEPLGDAVATRCEVDRVAGRRADCPPRRPIDPATDSTLYDRNRPCDFAASHATSHADADSSLHPRTDPRTDAGTDPRTDAGTDPRTDAGTDPRTDAPVDRLPIRSELAPVGTCYTAAAVSGRP